MESPLKEQWLALVRRYGADERIAEAWFAQLDKRYSAAGRHYHTLAHIEAILAAVEAHADTLADADAVRFAAWFHDAIYQPMRSDNELRSAQLAEKALSQLGFPASRLSAVRELILRTKNHTERLTGESDDLAFFLDCDLAVLGADEAQYQRYAAQIRQEYRMFPDFLYNPGRVKVLQQFLAVPHLYRTPFFLSTFEAPARRNLAAELSNLTRKP